LDQAICEFALEYEEQKQHWDNDHNAHGASQSPVITKLLLEGEEAGSYR
jgi:hypothetical protein